MTLYSTIKTQLVVTRKLSNAKPLYLVFTQQRNPKFDICKAKWHFDKSVTSPDSCHNCQNSL